MKDNIVFDFEKFNTFKSDIETKLSNIQKDSEDIYQEISKINSNVWTGPLAEKFGELLVNVYKNHEAIVAQTEHFKAAIELINTNYNTYDKS